jgi:hypothetical protein
MAKGGRWSDGWDVEVRDMRNAETTPTIIRRGIDHWRAVCGESRMHGSEGGRWKRAELIGTSPAAYPTRETRIGRPGHLARRRPEGLI